MDTETMEAVDMVMHSKIQRRPPAQKIQRRRNLHPRPSPHAESDLKRILIWYIPLLLCCNRYSLNSLTSFFRVLVEFCWKMFATQQHANGKKKSFMKSQDIKKKKGQPSEETDQGLEDMQPMWYGREWGRFEFAQRRSDRERIVRYRWLEMRERKHSEWFQNWSLKRSDVGLEPVCLLILGLTRRTSVLMHHRRTGSNTTRNRGGTTSSLQRQTLWQISKPQLMRGDKAAWHWRVNKLLKRKSRVPKQLL